MGAFPFSIIPGFLPAFQVAIELSESYPTSDCSLPAPHADDSESSKKIYGLHLVKSMRENFLEATSFGMVVQVVIALAFESIKLVSNLFWAGALLSLVSVVANFCLITSVDSEIAKIQAIEEKTLMPPKEEAILRKTPE